MDTITVYYNTEAILISKDYAALTGLKHGYVIKTESEFWGILGGHVRHEIKILEMLIEAEKSVN